MPFIRFYLWLCFESKMEEWKKPETHKCSVEQTVFRSDIFCAKSIWTRKPPRRECVAVAFFLILATDAKLLPSQLPSLTKNHSTKSVRPNMTRYLRIIAVDYASFVTKTANQFKVSEWSERVYNFVWKKNKKNIFPFIIRSRKPHSTANIMDELKFNVVFHGRWRNNIQNELKCFY